MRWRGAFGRLWPTGERPPPEPVVVADEAGPVCRHDVPYLPQASVERSAEASVRMLVGFHQRVSPRAVRVPRDAGASAPRTGAVLQMLRAAGLRPHSLTRDLPAERRWRPEALARHLRERGPIICSGTMHFVVLTGVDADRVWVHDPWHGRDRQRPLDAFDRFLWWSDPDCMVAARR